MSSRPIFNEKITVEEFNKYYWYKTELVSFSKIK
ncbi:hypothetical protein [Clostridium lundense]